MTLGEFVLCVAAIVAMFCAGFAIGRGIEAGQVRQEAVENGVAEWRVDKTGKVAFGWLPRAEKLERE